MTFPALFLMIQIMGLLAFLIEQYVWPPGNNNAIAEEIEKG